MKITFERMDRGYQQECYEELLQDIESFAPVDVQATPKYERYVEKNKTQKGDAVTIASILVTAVGAGGALTVALGKDGFLTRLASALETFVNRKANVFISDGKGLSVRLSGSAKDIRKMMANMLK